MMIDNYPYSICEDFINASPELISARSLYNHYLNCCDELKIANLQQSINHMIVLGCLIFNEDRPLNKFEVIRDAETLEYISTASIYDSGTSMV